MFLKSSTEYEKMLLQKRYYRISTKTLINICLILIIRTFTEYE